MLRPATTRYGPATMPRISTDAAKILRQLAKELGGYMPQPDPLLMRAAQECVRRQAAVKTCLSDAFYRFALIWNGTSPGDLGYKWSMGSGELAVRIPRKWLADLTWIIRRNRFVRIGVSAWDSGLDNLTYVTILLAREQKLKIRPFAKLHPPGARLTLSGSSTGATRVRLRLFRPTRGSTAAKARLGPNGGFKVSVRLPSKPGRYRVELDLIDDWTIIETRGFVLWIGVPVPKTYDPAVDLQARPRGCD